MEVVIAGGGIAAVETLLALRALAEDRVDIELLAPHVELVYRPLAVLEPFGLGGASSFSLLGLAAEQGARLRQDRLVAVDSRRRQAITASGAEIHYDALVIAIGAHPVAAVPGAITFTGPDDGPALAALVGELGRGAARRLAFAVPSGVVWTLPLYELALLTAARLAASGVEDPLLTVVTPEVAPLALFGEAASEAVAELLAARGIELLARRYPSSFRDRALAVVPHGRVPADRVVALPRLEGPRLRGLPSDADGFLPTDQHGRVRDVAGVFAAGDATNFPVKQGGLATQQADAVATSIAALVGAPVEPDLFRPVLRGLLLTGGIPRYLRAELTDGHAAGAQSEDAALWWPPSKVAGRHLAPHLAALGIAPAPPPATGGIPVQLTLPS